jgi:hypothetical protein
MAKFKPHHKRSLFKDTLQKKKSQLDLKKDNYLTISFRQLDREQGDNFYLWEKNNILARSVDVLANLCNDTVLSQKDGKKFTIYGDFPPKNKTDFYFPKHIPEDANWARIHITGLQCIIGHLVDNVFYVVFLDGKHKFWKSKLKNT